MTVALPSHHHDTIYNGVKQLKRRLPARARSTHRKKNSMARVTPKNSQKALPHTKASRLGKLRLSYARRGVSPPPLPPPHEKVIKAVPEVLEVSLAGAKSRYVHLEAPSDCEAYDSDSDAHSMGSSCPSSRAKFVQFASHCAVVEIPHFRQYSPEQREAMWNGSKKIRSMGRRNTAEYLYDGWNIETAAEEDEFVVVGGVPVHPAHVSMERKRQLLELEAE
jgi:hypothetical protein